MSRRRHLRRRLVAAVALLALAGAGVAVAVLAGGGGSGRRVRYDAGATASVRVITAPAPSLKPRGAPAFSPAPAVARAAAKLTLPDQVAQLFLVSLDGTGQSDLAGLSSVPWGGVLFTRANDVPAPALPALTASVTATVERAAPGPRPLLAADQPGGPGTAFPRLPPEGEAAVGATGRPAVATAQAEAAGRRLRGLGFAMTIAPLADVDVPDGALTGQLFGSDPALVARFALAAAQGYAATGLLAAAAHFPGEGAASADPDQATATVGGSLGALEDRDLIPFEAIIAHVPVVTMSNAEYVAFDGVTPASLLPAAVRLLRDTLGFGGVVMSGDLAAALQPTGESIGQVAVQALRAGDDLLLATGPPALHLEAYNAVLAAAEASATVRALVRAALLRDLTLKARAGLLSGTKAGGTAAGAATGTTAGTG